jgi:hypothetical protein
MHQNVSIYQTSAAIWAAVRELNRRAVARRLAVLDQHHADIYAMLQMQKRLIAALREALPWVPSDEWVEQTVTCLRSFLSRSCVADSAEIDRRRGHSYGA